MRGKYLAALVFLAVGIVTSAAEPVSKTVTIDSGAIEGAVLDGILSFKGIPYAKPPVDHLRWRPPQPVTPWTNVRDATMFGSDCIQIAGETQAKGKEDCLFLNVWRPAEAGPGEPLPILVWIHGGGYLIGGTSLPLLDGSALARQGLVVVTMNYRLGRLGFFAHPALIAANEDPPKYSGNFGYMDQIRALEWVRTNVEKFGGNPNQVTIAGESAGGGSVLHLLTSPVTKGLFHRVIVMSGGGRRAMLVRQMTGGTPETPSADLIDAAFAAICGIDAKEPNALAKLRSLPATTVVVGMAPNEVAETLRAVPLYAGTPVIDGKIVVGEPGKIISAGGPAIVPMIIGTTTLEPPLYFPPKKDDLYPWSYFGPHLPEAFAIYSFNPATATFNIGMDMSMHEASRFVARMITKHSNPAWLYRFEYVLESMRPFVKEAFHAEDVPFLFQTLDKMSPRPILTDMDKRMAALYSGYFTNFAKSPLNNPNPNGAGLLPWPKFDAASFQLMNFTMNDGAVFGDTPDKKRIELVERAAGPP